MWPDEERKCFASRLGNIERENDWLRYSLGGKAEKLFEAEYLGVDIECSYYSRLYVCLLHSVSRAENE